MATIYIHSARTEKRAVATTLTTGLSSNFQSKRREQSGFTLLEMLLVLVISAAILAITAPSLRNFLHARPLADCAAKLIALTEYAKSHAISEGRAYQVCIDLEEQTFYLLAEEESGEFYDIGKEFGTVFKFPDDVAIENVVTPTADSVTSVPGLIVAEPLVLHDDKEKIIIGFSPIGTTQPLSFFLIGHGNRRLEIVCDSPIEGFRIEEPKQEVM